MPIQDLLATSASSMQARRPLTSMAQDVREVVSSMVHWIFMCSWRRNWLLMSIRMPRFASLRALLSIQVLFLLLSAVVIISFVTTVTMLLSLMAAV